MKVRLLADLAGLGIHASRGQVIDLPPEDAFALIRAKQAEGLDPEAAAERPGETATLKTGRPKKGRRKKPKE